MRFPWPLLVLAGACSASADLAPPRDSSEYEIRMQDLEARVEALQEDIRRHRHYLGLPPVEASIDAAPQDAGSE